MLKRNSNIPVALVKQNKSEPSPLPLEIVCGSCGAVLYSGFDLKSPKDIVRMVDGKCKACGKPLSSHEYSVDVGKSQMGQ